jgi:WD40 repeat protein
MTLSVQLHDECSLHLQCLLLTGLIHCLDWSAAYLAVASNKHCAIYDTQRFILLHETSRRLTTIQALKFNIDGSYLAMGERDVVILEGIPPFRIHCEISNTPFDSRVPQTRYKITSLCWSSSGSFLAIAGSDGVCLVVETKGFAVVHQIQRPESINALSWESQYLAVSDDSCKVALIKAGTDLADSSQMDDYSLASSSSHFCSETSTDWVLREDAFRDVEDVAPAKLPREVKSQARITTVAFSRRRTSTYFAYAADDCSLSIMTTRDWKVVYQSKFTQPLVMPL